MKLTLKAARINAGYKAKDVAKAVGIRAAYFSQIEAGLKPIKADQLEGMLKLYGVDRRDICIEEKTVFYAR